MKLLRSNVAILVLVLCIMALLQSARGFGFGGGRRHEPPPPAVIEEIDQYAVLGLTEDATDKEIKRAYRKLSLKYHPDHNQGNEEASKEFMKVSAAYEILSNEEKKFLYDMGGMEAVAQAGDRNGGGNNQMADMFGGFFGGNQRQGNRGQDAQMQLRVTLEELYSGGEKTAQIDRRVVCRGCAGKKGKGKEKCAQCGRCPNEYKMVQRQVGPGFMVQQQEEVPSKEKCKMEKKELLATIERGAQDGHQIRFPYASEQRPGQIPGDVIIILKQSKHNVFERKGDHLHMTAKISLKEALVGFTKTITHLDGHSVEIDRSNKVTRPFQTVVIRGEGMPVHEVPSEFGDLHVTFEVQFPKQLTAEQLEAVQKVL